MSGPTKTVTNFAGCDYLGLSAHPQIIEALCRAARQHGISATSSRWALGWTELHEQLEQALARFMGTEDACILPTAYLGGPVYYASLTCQRRTVFCDELVHTNHLLGMRAEGLTIRTFKHLDVEDLQRQLANHDGSPAIIATDGIYSIGGEVAPLAELAALADSIGAELFIDDAHGVAAVGASGRGSAELAGLQPHQATILGSMSKAMGCAGFGTEYRFRDPKTGQ
ncbi:MAG: aminotransferase class I/II-fold pyridoxal phosphate-dependent enzyme, partial [Phycisphaerae bacterium]